MHSLHGLHFNMTDPDARHKTGQKKGIMWPLNLTTLGAGIKQIKPTNKGGSKTRLSHGGMKKRPVDPVKRLFLVQWKNSNMSISGSGITNHIPKKGNTITYKKMGHSAGLTLVNN